MATFRTIKESGDFVTVHKSFVFDSNLSAKAKGILLYFLSRPDNWQIYTSEVVKHMNDGQKSINSGVQELMDNKYVHRIQKRAENGVFKGFEYLVYEKTNRNAIFGKRIIGKRVFGKRKNGKPKRAYY
ncbi:putative phage replication protein [Staphylococcus aureus]|nr:putative phage replication protein [Staphylococcus aureus]